MKFHVIDVEIDGLDEYGDGIPEFQLTYDEGVAIRDSALGIWEAKDEEGKVVTVYSDEEDLIEVIIDEIGFYPIIRKMKIIK